jgi:hypothetical protein
MPVSPILDLNSSLIAASKAAALAADIEDTPTSSLE